jgi:thiol peroxidase
VNLKLKLGDFMIQTTNRSVTSKGNPLTLIGNDLKVGQPAPECKLITNNFSEFRLSSLRGKKVILSVVPSLDTSVCSLQTKRFNKEAIDLGDEVAVVTISMDLPSAQARWCGATESKQIQTLSDHRSAAFGEAYGVLIKELRLLSRSVFVVDEKGVLRYKQIVSEITHEPNYEEVLEAVKKL